jgi:hypothetical protein
MADAKLARQPSSAVSTFEPLSPPKRSASGESAQPPAKRRPTETVLTAAQRESVRTMVCVPTRHNQDPAAKLIALGTSTRESATGWLIHHTTALLDEQTMSNSGRTQRDSFSIDGFTIKARYPEGGIDSKIASKWQRGELPDDSPEINNQLLNKEFSTDVSHSLTSLTKKMGPTAPRVKHFYIGNAHGMTVRSNEYNGLVTDEFQANRIELNAPVSWAALARHSVVRTNSNGTGTVLMVAPNDANAVPNQLVKVPEAKQSYHARESSMTDPDVCMWNVYVMQFRKEGETLTRSIFKLTAWSDVVLRVFNITRGDLWTTFQETLLSLDSFGSIFSNEEQFKETSSDVSSIFSTLDGANPTSMAFNPQSINLKMNGAFINWDNVLSSFFKVPMDFAKSLMRFAPRPKSVTTDFSKDIDTDMVNNVLRKYQRSVGKNITGNNTCEIWNSTESKLFAMHTDVEFQAQLIALRNLDNVEVFMVPICSEFIVNDAKCAEIAMKLGGKCSSSAIVTIDAITVFNNLARVPHQEDLAIIFEPLQECPAMIFMREKLRVRPVPEPEVCWGTTGLALK